MIGRNNYGSDVPQPAWFDSGNGLLGRHSEFGCRASRLAQDDVVLTLVKDGDHRLSRPEDLERLVTNLYETPSEMVETVKKLVPSVQ